MPTPMPRPNPAAPARIGCRLRKPCEKPTSQATNRAEPPPIDKAILRSFCCNIGQNTHKLAAPAASARIALPRRVGLKAKSTRMPITGEGSEAALYGRMIQQVIHAMSCLRRAFQSSTSDRRCGRRFLEPYGQTTVNRDYSLFPDFALGRRGFARYGIGKGGALR